MCPMHAGFLFQFNPSLLEHSSVSLLPVADSIGVYGIDDDACGPGPYPKSIDV